MINLSAIVVLILAALVGTVSTARTARLLTHDTYPPVQWLRNQWDAKVTGAWNELMHCPFCLAPYLMAGMFAWWWVAWSIGGLAQAVWWYVNTWWALSYLAAILVARDQPEVDVVVRHGD